ncbi:MAG: FtsX-like permease family protein [Planctomycetota bacterium]
MYKLFLSFRYFRSRPINLIPVVCMMLGVMALIVILAIMNGFQSQLKATLRGTLSDLIINVYYESDFEKWEEVLLETEGIEAASPHLRSFSLVAEIPPPVSPGAKPRRAQMDGAMVRGIDGRREAEVSQFQDYLRFRPFGAAGRSRDRTEYEISTPDPERPFVVINPRWSDKPGVILGRPLAELLGVRRPMPEREIRGETVYAYDRVYLTTMEKAPGDKEYSAKQQDFCVTGIYESGNRELDAHIAFLDRAAAREFFQIVWDPEEIRIHLTDYGRADEIKRILRRRAREIYAATSTTGEPWRGIGAPFRVQTWEDRRRVFLNAVENEKGLIAIIAGMAFIVTGFMIFSILSMIVTMKTRDIGILKALGGTTLGMLQIFVFNGFFIGVIGSLAGMGLGLLTVQHINWIRDQVNRMFGWDPFPAHIYLFRDIPTRVSAEEIVAVTAMAMIVALVGAILPALKAGSLDPVESLRYE